MPTPEAIAAAKELHSENWHGMTHDQMIEVGAAAIDKHTAKQRAAYNDLMGQIRAMKERSDKYAREAEAGAEISEADKHRRVFGVLKELERLGEAFRIRE